MPQLTPIIRLRSPLLLGIAIIILVCLLSVFSFSSQSIRFDEAQTLWTSSHGIGQVIHSFAQYAEPPVYSLLLQGWILVFGNSITIARLLSFIFFFISIACMYLLGEISFGRPRYGIFAATLFALSPFMNWYANEARMYSLLAFLAILNQYFFTKAVKQNSVIGWIYYGFTLVIGVYTHYFFLCLPLAHLIFLLIYRSSPKILITKKIFYGFLIAFLASVLAFLPWVVWAHPWTIFLSLPAQTLASSQIFGIFSNFFFGFTNDHANIIIISFWPMIVLLAFLVLRKNTFATPLTMLSIITIAVIVLSIIILSLTLHTALLGPYLILTFPSICLFLSFFVFSYPRHLSLIFQTILIVLMLAFLLFEAFNADLPVAQDYQGAALYLDQNAGPSDAIVLSSPPTIFPFEYYYQGQSKVLTLPSWDIANASPPSELSPSDLVKQADSLKKTYQNLWLLLSQDQGYHSTVKEYLDTHFEKIYEKNFSSNLNLYLYKLNYK
jgi:mannosyltransferase